MRIVNIIWLIALILSPGFVSAADEPGGESGKPSNLQFLFCTKTGHPYYKAGDGYFVDMKDKKSCVRTTTAVVSPPTETLQQPKGN